MWAGSRLGRQASHRTQWHGRRRAQGRHVSAGEGHRWANKVKGRRREGPASGAACASQRNRGRQRRQRARLAPSPAVWAVVEVPPVPSWSLLPALPMLPALPSAGSRWCGPALAGSVRSDVPLHPAGPRACLSCKKLDSRARPSPHLLHKVHKGASPVRWTSKVVPPLPTVPSIASSRAASRGLLPSCRLPGACSSSGCSAAGHPPLAAPPAAALQH